MPKIIENLDKLLLNETKRQLQEAGYSVMTIRSVAHSCGVGTGTVYNYYPSKEALVAACLLEDWQQCLDRIRDAASKTQEPKAVTGCIYAQLLEFTNRHQAIFRDPAAAASFSGSFSRYHSVLRQQLAEPLQQFCTEEFAALFIAEALLRWTMEGKPFDAIYEILKKLF